MSEKLKKNERSAFTASIQTVVTECVIWVWTHHYRSKDIYTSNFISCTFCAGIHFDVCAYDGTAEEEGICTVPRLLILKGEKYKEFFFVFAVVVCANESSERYKWN